MIGKIILTVVIFFNLIGCTSIVDMDIPLSKQFKQNSNLIVIERPTWRVPDSVYNRKLGNYNTINSKTTSKSYDKTLVGRETTNGSFLNYLLFDKPLYSVINHYNVEMNQRFSFNLVKDGIKKGTSKCEIFSQSLAQESHEFSGLGHTDRKNSNLAKVYLLCTIENGTQSATLVLESYAYKPLVVRLSSNDLKYTTKEVLERYDILSNGEKRSSPPWLSISSGLKMYKGMQQVSAVSLLNKSKIRITQSLSVNEKELLLSANFCLTMFTWLEDSWR